MKIRLIVLPDDCEPGEFLSAQPVFGGRPIEIWEIRPGSEITLTSAVGGCLLLRHERDTVADRVLTRAGRNPAPHEQKGARMTNVFDEETDAPQSADQEMPTGRFRLRYRALSPEEKNLHDDIKATAIELEQLFECVTPGRYKSLGLTALEESVMWIIKQLTA